MVVERTEPLPTTGPASERERFDSVIARCRDPFVEVDGSGVVREWNPPAEQLFGWMRHEVVGRPAVETLLPGGFGPAPQFPTFFEAGGGDRRSFDLVHRSGHTVPAEGSFFVSEPMNGSQADRTIAGFVQVVGDVDGPAPVAFLPPGCDPLTGLPDRIAFGHQAADVLAVSPTAGSVAVVLLDLDRFKVINSSLGHDAGDLVLVAMADRLLRLGGGAEVVARFGGDEFLALFSREEGALPSATAFVELVRGALSHPFEVAGNEVFVDASAGIALNTFGVDDATELLSNAESAMYRAKSRGGSSVDIFGESMRIEVLDRMSTERSLHRAIERRELMLHYQPVVEIEGVTTVGVEALVRWQHPEQGLVAPGRFIPVAEESGLIIPIGAWVLEQACHQLSDWHLAEDAGPRGSIEVNLSAGQIDDPRIVKTVGEILARTGLPPEQLTLEITESALMRDATVALRILRALKDMGVLLAIDDFGTGYSSLSYLQRFPLDILKVDRSFVSELGASVEGEEIVSAVINLAHALGLRVVAEGVETTEQLDVLRSFRCDLAQGFLFSKPLPASQIVASFGLPVSA